MIAESCFMKMARNRSPWHSMVEACPAVDIYFNDYYDTNYFKNHRIDGTAFLEPPNSGNLKYNNIQILRKNNEQDLLEFIKNCFTNCLIIRIFVFQQRKQNNSLKLLNTLETFILVPKKFFDVLVIYFR